MSEAMNGWAVTATDSNANVGPETEVRMASESVPNIVITVWALKDATLSGVRSVLLRTAHRLLEWDDGIVYRPSVGGSLHFTLHKVS